MDRHIADLLAAAARKYDYPKTRLTLASATYPAAFEAQGVTYGIINQAALTYPQFEAGIASDLRSGNPERRQLGFLSVIFWGHLSRNERFALHKAKLAAHMEDADLGAHLTAVIARVDAGEFGQALAACEPLHGVGSTSFASKLVACLAPERCGIFDQQIYRYLAAIRLEPNKSALEAWLDEHLGAWAWTAQGTFSSGQTVAMSRGYQAWCEFLRHAASQLSDLAPRPSAPWRAIDVERAIFVCAKDANRKREKARATRPE
ncbi:hypothetical protein [Phenylobacterium sp. 58.2.17]|uniref:hypothetical protein n=1 Tax=Phenylobacterium sp. 58.2.17 TaxID=2969306 RepID=UPI002263B4E6|nr:hypothetical protein [Phenylobacterium sp. 58.2.17]MCX7584897.1 hypothetical protein [Phenylobacterium sp. 58.2.17]